jgi:uncharacterized protein (DUF302 family)
MPGCCRLSCLPPLLTAEMGNPQVRYCGLKAGPPAMPTQAKTGLEWATRPRAKLTRLTEASMAPATSAGIIDKPSNHSVEQTVDKLKNILQSKGVTLFALIDHSGEAEKIGMKMPSTKLLIFGNPKAGTPLMLAAPSSAIDLPLKILIWEDARGKVWVTYNSPVYLQERHSLPPELLQNIAVVETLATKAAE